nr:MAG TPA: hypothetical protein [Caudoviricetes sp.]
MRLRSNHAKMIFTACSVLQKTRFQIMGFIIQ